MGVDWAKEKDFTVLTVMDADKRLLVDMDRFNKVDWELQRGRLKAMHDKWKCERIVAEKNSIGGPNIEALRREGLPVLGFEMTSTSKMPLIESLVLGFERKQLSIPNHHILIGELEAYEMQVSKRTGHTTYGAPEGLHDDCVISLALAWKAVNTARLTAY